MPPACASGPETLGDSSARRPPPGRTGWPTVWAACASQHVNLAVAAKAPLERVLTFAAERGWRRLRLLSSAGTTYNRDYLAETADGSQQPMLNVFHREGRAIRHFWGSELFYAPADPRQEPRHVGTIEPLWNLFDLTREGRPADWHEQFSY